MESIETAASGADSPAGEAVTRRLVCIFAERPEWVFFEEAQTEDDRLQPEIPATWRELARAGWDLAWMDLLAERDQRGLGSVETEAFVKLLEITRDEQPIDSAPSPGAAPLEVMRQAQQSVGSRVDWKVRLVHGSLVELEHDGVAQRYFQLDGFVQIPGQVVKYAVPDAPETIAFEGEFPVTIVTMVASEFVPPETGSAGDLVWKVGRHARLRGRFFRLWSYRSERMEAATESGRQVAPLVMATRLEAARPERLAPSPVGWFGYALAVGLVVIMSAIIGTVWRDIRRQPRGSRRKTASSTSKEPPK